MYTIFDLVTIVIVMIPPLLMIHINQTIKPEMKNLVKFDGSFQVNLALMSQYFHLGQNLTAFTLYLAYWRIIDSLRVIPQIEWIFKVIKGSLSGLLLSVFILQQVVNALSIIPYLYAGRTVKLVSNMFASVAEQSRMAFGLLNSKSLFVMPSWLFNLWIFLLTLV